MTYRQTGSSLSFTKREEGYNSQFSVILEVALKRSGDAVRFFERKGESSQRIINRAFFLYLSVKKEAQRAILEKIAYSLGLEKALEGKTQSNYSGLELHENEVEEDYCTIFQTIQKIAADELEFYLNYAGIENEPKVKSFIFMLADLSKEFLFDVKIWYLNHKESMCYSNAGMHETVSSDYVVEAVLN
jgi:hypothetical protein